MYMEILKRMDDQRYLLKILLIAFAGGIARYLDAFLKGEEFSWIKFSARVVSSGFFGYLAANLVGLYNIEWAFIASGIAGYGGSELANLLIRVYAKFIGKQTGVEITDEELDQLRTTTKRRNKNGNRTHNNSTIDSNNNSK